MDASESFEKLRARYERLKLLHHVANVIHSTLEPQDALQLIASEAVRVMRASSGSVVLINPTTGFLEIQATQGLPENAAALKLRVGEGITGWVARTGKAARVGEVFRDPRYIGLRENIQSELAVPLEVNGEIRGVLNVDSERKNAFSAEDQDLLEALAEQAAKVIQNTWLFEQLRLKARLFESLANVSRVLNSTLNLDDALSVIAREACVLMNGKMCSLMMLDEQRQWLDLRASFGAGSDYLGKPRVAVDDSLLGVVVRRKKPLQVLNVQTSGRYQNSEVARREGLVSLASVPLLFAGEAIGTLSVYTGKLYQFSDEEIRILSALSELSAIAIQKARLYERVVDVEEQLRQNEKFSALGLLAAEVAHEIRNPLTVMKMLYHSLDLKFPETDPRAKDSKMIGEKINQLNKIVERVLDLARTSEPNLAAVNLNQLIDELGLLVRHKLKNQNVRWITRLETDLPAVFGDATQLEQVFLNLILNAVEAMPDGGKLTIRSRLKIFSDGRRMAFLEIKDTGNGMTEEQQRRAFSSLLQTSKRTGTGLGLAIVKQIVETHHGKITLRSRRGKGTQLSIELPVCAEAN
ncbi:MAG TPA: GAF domain-containing protein [Verrucomicrobiae bacterium]|nr:GAF domain-containing protein [Verrucomicrobiae bacterium]